MLDVALDSAIAGIIAGILAIMFVFVFWPRKGKYCINLRRTSCPECGKKLPVIRRPVNERQNHLEAGPAKSAGQRLIGMEIRLLKRLEQNDLPKSTKIRRT